MIKETGTVVITKDQVLVTGFTFEAPYLPTAQDEAVAWAMEMLRNPPAPTGDASE
jgi:hypothetical protein